MKSQIIFIAGIYGVGKSFLCNKLSCTFNIPFYSSGDLISQLNGEVYGSNKSVKDKDKNQDLLIEAVNKKLINEKNFLLAGHFSILNSNMEIELLPDYVFEQLHIKIIVLLEADPCCIAENLKKRDNKEYPIDVLIKMSCIEKEQAVITANRLNIPLITYKLSYEESDERELKKKLKDGGLI